MGNQFDIRTIAIYLPQYHPVPENDLWWGKGFTEWANVAKAKPLFKDHYQPHLPADLGFYDLRLPEVREQQAALAKAYGIYGFCYYHYWFNGKRMLERPFEEVFKSGKPDFPFMLCWANENWTRSWDGGNNEILLEQKYSAEDDLKHIQSLIAYFEDPRYIRIGDKPVVAIYRSTLLPDPAATIKIWRAEAAKHGMELYICRVESFSEGGANYLEAGFDAAIDFQPWGTGMSLYKASKIADKQRKFSFRIKNFFYREVAGKFSEEKYRSFRQQFKAKEMNDYVIDYNEYTDFIQLLELPEYKRFPCVMPMWDNTARLKSKLGVFYNNEPRAYQNWLNSTVRKFEPYSKDENLVFINAWNEWGEGNHLEPCQKWGNAFLMATREALLKIK